MSIMSVQLYNSTNYDFLTNNSEANTLVINPKNCFNISSALNHIMKSASVMELQEAIKVLENEIKQREKELHNAPQT